MNTKASRTLLAGIAMTMGLSACGDDTTSAPADNTGGTIGGAGGAAGSGGDPGGSGGAVAGAGGEAMGGAGGEAMGGAGGAVEPIDPTLDTDEDGLTDVEELERYGTNPFVADTDGDGFDDYNEVVEKAFDAENNNFQFNPLIADVPQYEIELTSTPQFYMVYSEGNQTGRTVGTEHEQSITEGTTRSWGGSQSHSVEMTHTAGVEVSTEVEIGLFGGVSASASLSYEFSHSTTNETSTNWNQDQSRENSEALARIEEREQSESVEITGGAVVTTVVVRNTGHLAFMLEDLSLSAYNLDPSNPLELGSIGNLFYNDGLDIFPRTVVLPGDATAPLNFAADVDLPTIKDVLADSRNMVVAPATGVVLDQDGRSFELEATNINARTAQVIIDFGDARKQESYRVATVLGDDRQGVTAQQVFTDILRVPYTTGTSPWRFGAEATPGESFQGVTGVRGIEMSDEESAYWLVAHTYPIDGGADTQTDYYNPILEGFDFDALTLKSGHILHLVRISDADRDGLGERAEFLYGTDPENADTDGDGAGDALEAWGWTITDAETGDERRVFPNPLRTDTDHDGVDDYEEYQLGTDPTEAIVNVAPEVTDLQVELEGFTTHLTVTVADENAESGDWVESFTVDWGDGSPLEMVALEQDQTMATLNHRYDRSGTFTAEVIAWDGDLESAPSTISFHSGVAVDGLVLHYDFDSASVENGYIYDASNNGNDGDYENPGFATDRFGRGEQAGDLLNGNNAGQLGLVSVADIDLGNAFTFSVWIHANSNGNGERILGKGNGFNLYFASSDRVAFGRLDGLHPDGFEARDNGRHSDDEWVHYAGVAREVGGDVELTLYRNGNAVGSDTQPGAILDNGCRIYAGAFPDGSQCSSSTPDEFSGFPGRMDDVRVYDRALSPDEITALYEEPEPAR
ncbi:MAG: LamG-like jellyroll fold domain-containing protein [Bradymonadia bacterium]